MFQILDTFIKWYIRFIGSPVSANWTAVTEDWNEYRSALKRQIIHIWQTAKLVRRQHNLIPRLKRKHTLVRFFLSCMLQYKYLIQDKSYRIYCLSYIWEEKVTEIMHIHCLMTVFLNANHYGQWLINSFKVNAKTGLWGAVWILSCFVSCQFYTMVLFSEKDPLHLLCQTQIHCRNVSISPAVAFFLFSEDFLTTLLQSHFPLSVPSQEYTKLQDFLVSLFQSAIV